MKEQESILTSIEEFREFIEKNADDGNIISVVLELTEAESPEGGGPDG